MIAETRSMSLQQGEMMPAIAVLTEHRTKAESFQDHLSAGVVKKTALEVPKGEIIFRQGDPAHSIFYIQRGRVKISVTSLQGKEATLALHNQGGFIGEECIAASHSLRLATASAILPCTILRIGSKEMVQALEADKSFARLFQTFLLTRCTQMQASLIDHLFNSSEKRLARTLLLLAQLDGKSEATVQNITQEILAEMIGTTRSRVSFFMNNFRRMGYIDYNGYNGVKVHHSLCNVLVKD
jgi:CRP/FNR family transcriptional regulator, cyclic AMP receptor protein